MLLKAKKWMLNCYVIFNLLILENLHTDKEVTWSDRDIGR